MVLEQRATQDKTSAAQEALDRMMWRRSLSDVDVRSLAFEYRQHEKNVHDGVEEEDPCLLDAWLEYKERFGGTPHKEFVKAAKARGNRRKKHSISPLYDERGQLL